MEVCAVIRLVAFGLAVALVGAVPQAFAADLPMLQTSEFEVNQDSPTVPQVADVKASDAEIKLSMMFDELIANADGPKMEGSSSMIGELIVSQPDSVTLPEMHVTISGHIVKTAPSVARIDLQIGETRRSFTWARDEEKSGQFEISYSEVVPGGKVPPVFPVSAIALVTKEAKGSVVLVTLEKLDVTIGSTRVAAKE
jgi:hypothetical protein